MNMNFTLKKVFNASPSKIYATWLSSEGHSRMTGGSADISDMVGARFTAWDGYITGKNISLEPYKRILQSWRTSQFEENEEDAQLEILLYEVDGQTELILIHSKLPESSGHYKKGWEEHYFLPMQIYFS